MERDDGINKTIVLSAVLMLVAGPAAAQQVTGELGSPGATTTISEKQLPPPDPKFGGVIKEKASESKAWWAPRVVPPKGAPNVLLSMTDDVGFGAPGIALIALGVACWSGTPRVGLLTYSGAVTLYLASVGFAGGLTGILLWPAVVLHVILTALLTRAVPRPGEAPKIK